MTRPGRPGSALAALLGQTSAAEFAAEVWSRRTLLRARSTGADLTGLLTLDDVDTLLGSHALRTPFVRIAKDGHVAAASTFTRPGGVGARIGDQIDGDRVTELLADGSTVVLQGLHRAWPSVQDFVTGLTVDLGHPVQANAYLTPPAARGFAAHYDTHDVFVVQLAGTKQWTVHTPAVDAAGGLADWTQHRDAVADIAQHPPELDVLLTPGDVLYLPRGWIHSAQANDALSLHLTLGVHPYTARDVLDAAVSEALADLPVHGALPAGIDVSDPDAIEQTLESVRRSLGDALAAVKTDAVAARLAARRHRDVRPEPLRPTAQVSAALAVDDVRVTLRAGVRPRVQEGPAGVELVLDGRALSFPSTHLDALRRVAAADELVPAHLPGLDAESARELVRGLLLAGVLVPVRP